MVSRVFLAGGALWVVMGSSMSASAQQSAAIAIGASPAPSLQATPFVVTVNVDGDAGVPTGQVRVLLLPEGSECAAYLDGGTGICSLSQLYLGEEQLEAIYSGDYRYDGGFNNTSHSAIAQSPFAISGAASAAFDAGYTIDLTNLAPTGTLSISVDGVVQQTTPYTTPPATATVIFDTSYSAGCHLVTAANEDASANPLGVALFPAGVPAGACDPGMAAAGVAVAAGSTAAGPGVPAFGVNATLTQGGGAPGAAAMLVAMLPGNPAPVPVQSVTASYDVRGVGLAPADSVTVVMLVAPGTPASSLSLAYVDPSTGVFSAVLTSAYTYDRTTGTVTLVLNANTAPQVTDLSGTTFWLVDRGGPPPPDSGAEDAGSGPEDTGAGSVPDATTSADAEGGAGTDAGAQPDAAAPQDGMAPEEDATAHGADAAAPGADATAGTDATAPGADAAAGADATAPGPDAAAPGADATAPAADAAAPSPDATADDAGEGHDANATGSGASSASGGCNCGVAAAPGTTATGALLVACGALSLALRRRRRAP
jgi:hypothetical protein